MKILQQKKNLTYEYKKVSFNYLIYLKEDRCGKIKSRNCAIGRKQSLYESKDGVTSPIMAIESIFPTITIDTEEHRYIIVYNILGAYLYEDIHEEKIVHFEEKMTEILYKIVKKCIYTLSKHSQEGKYCMYNSRRLSVCLTS